MSKYDLIKGKINIGDKLVHSIAGGIWTVVGYDKITKEYTLIWDRDDEKHTRDEEILRQTFGRYIDRCRDLSNNELKAILVEALKKIGNKI